MQKRVKELLEILINELKLDPTWGIDELYLALEQFTDYEVVNSYFEELNKHNEESIFDFCFDNE